MENPRNLGGKIYIALLLVVSSPSIAYEQQVEKLSTELAIEISDASIRTIAVVDFTDLQGNVTELGRFLAEEFSVAMAGPGREFEVVDRTHLGSILREHKLSTTGLIDPQTARQLGKIIGVEGLITGTITPFGDSVRITVKILNTESARIIGSAMGNVPRTGAIETLLGRDIGFQTQSSEPRPLAAVSQKVVESNDFEFTLQECRRSGSKLTCIFLVTNKGTDGDLRIDLSSRIVDNLGNEYKIQALKFGDDQTRPGEVRVQGFRIGGGSSLNKRLAANVPIRVEAAFADVSSRASSLALLDIQCYARRRSFSAQIRSIPIL